MEASIMQNKNLLRNAQNRAKDLIANYIKTIGELKGVEYKIEWVYEDGTTETEVDEQVENIEE